MLTEAAVRSSREEAAHTPFALERARHCTMLIGAGKVTVSAHQEFPFSGPFMEYPRPVRARYGSQMLYAAQLA